MPRINEIGFKLAGHWKSSKDGIVFELNGFGAQKNVLYCFVVAGDVVYVGKTVNSLQHRMQRYKTPARKSPKEGGTNIKNNKNIRGCLAQGKGVEIFVLPDNGLLHYGKFHVNLAAGLEDSIVKGLAPLWNGGKKESPQQALVPTVDDAAPPA